MRYFFTACAYNYYPSAKALLKSVKALYPDSKFYFFLVDRFNGYDPKDDGFDKVFHLEDIQQQLPLSLNSWIFSHNVMELSTAVKPFLLDHILQLDDCEEAIFIDPDSYVFNRLNSVHDALSNSSIVIAPHLSKLPGEDEIDRELGPMMHGVYNLGFLAVKPTTEGKKFALWWKARLIKHCVVERAKGLFTDQKWINLVPCYFEDIVILRSSTLNVATWNSFQRNITGTGPLDIYTDGEPMEFYHFAGIYSGRHDRVTERVTKGKELLFELSDWYIGEIKKDRSNPLLSGDWGYDFFENGEKITMEHRRFYREREELLRTYPNPFLTSSVDCFKNRYLKHLDATYKKSDKYKLDQTLMSLDAIQQHNVQLLDHQKVLSDRISALELENAQIRLLVGLKGLIKSKVKRLLRRS